MVAVDVLFNGYVGDRVAFVEDPRATHPELLQPNRDRVLEVATIIVPGHGASFAAAAAPRLGDPR